MTEREEELRRRLLVTFKGEAAEHIGLLSRHLLELEQGPAAGVMAQLVEHAFREAHSLKGAARAVNLGDIERVCQAMEGLFAAVKRGAIALTPRLIDVLLQAVRVLEELAATMEAGSASTPAIVAALTAVMQEAPAGADTGGRQVEPGVAPAAAAVPAPEAPPTAVRAGEDMVRVATARLDAVRRQAEELLPERLAAVEAVATLQRLRGGIADWQKQWRRARGDLRALQAMDGIGADPGGGVPVAGRAAARLLALLERNRAFIDGLEQRLSELHLQMWQDQRSLAQKLDRLLEDSGSLLLLPCSWLLDGLRHAAYDLARDLGKDVAFTVSGEAIEIDRRILTELKDPFIHMLRNAIDHGIEPPAEREAAGKPPRGAVTLTIERTRGNRVAMRLDDDGRGIDPAGVRAAAVRAGLLSAAQAGRLDEAESLDLVFQSELTTSPLITELSGRGLGLAIVRDKVERLGGRVHLESRPGTGTTLQLDLPLSRATFRGVVVQEGRRSFVLPAADVERVLRVARAQIRTVENRESIELDGRTVALVRLSRLLDLPPPTLADRQPALLLAAAGRRIAFLVEAVGQEQEVLVKGLGPHLQGLPLLAGATVLGNGQVAPVLDTAELIRAAIRWSESAPMAPPAAEPGGAPERRRSILVAEDSITSRTLLKNILEAADFAVETAVDGVDAYTRLRGGEFDLVVSDVDMPRLNGLGLTAKIRADRRLAGLPVVLVTSLDSRADRERGIAVGANAYIVKRSFEQSNLLEVIRRLL